MELHEFLAWLQGATGIGIAGGALLSFVAENISAYGNLSAKAKRLVFLGVCLALPFAAAGVARVLGGPAFTIELVFALLWAGGTAGFSGTVAHVRKL